MYLEKFFIHSDQAVLVIIDVQERLAKAMEEEVLETTLGNILKLVEVCSVLRMPVVVTEQYPKGLGSTVEELKSLIPSYQPIEKISFDACLEPIFMEILKQLNRKKIILTGMETHICVYQTTLSLLHQGYEVFIVKDAVCSRKRENHTTGLQLCILAGAIPVDTETLVFQLLKKAGTEEFKKISKLFK